MTLLALDEVSLRIGDTQILDRVSLSVGPSETLALVGESGSGKSMTALATMRLLPPQAVRTGGIRFEGRELSSLAEAQMSDLRGAGIGMVFQEPMTALNPLKTIGEQVAEGIRRHTNATRRGAEESAAAMLDRVGLPAARFPLGRYPHELSGGQRQRVVIAIACACNPKLLIADEPTTALDTVIQAQILDLLRGLVAERRMGLLLISHDLAVVAGMADRIAVMRQGRVVESGKASQVLRERNHPYTRQLAEASQHVPARAAPTESAHPEQALLEVRDLTKVYPVRRVSLFGKPPGFRAVDGVSFTIRQGRSVALVGRSGCGKSTLARMILALDRPTSGSVRLAGRDVHQASSETLRAARRDMQVVFQDPYGSFDPRQRVETLVAEPLHLSETPFSRAQKRDRVAEALGEVGLGPESLDRYPHEFSGGQRQRLAIARALITRPNLIVADEPVSALDVSIRARILDLFARLNERLGLTYLFITHDLHVARAVTDDVLVMDAGRIVERGSTEAVLDDPQSDAAKQLVAAAPSLSKALGQQTAPA